LRCDQGTYDDLLAACRRHRQQLGCPPTLDSLKEGFGPPRVGLGPMPERYVTIPSSRGNSSDYLCRVDEDERGVGVFLEESEHRDL